MKRLMTRRGGGSLRAIIGMAAELAYVAVIPAAGAILCLLLGKF